MFSDIFFRKITSYDTVERGHHQPNATVWDENKPEQLVEKFQVRSTLEDKASVREPNHSTPENVAENGRVRICDIEDEIGDVEVLAPKKPVNVLS